MYVEYNLWDLYWSTAVIITNLLNVWPREKKITSIFKWWFQCLVYAMAVTKAVTELLRKGSNRQIKQNLKLCHKHFLIFQKKIVSDLVSKRTECCTKDKDCPPAKSYIKCTTTILCYSKYLFIKKTAWFVSKTSILFLFKENGEIKLCNDCVYLPFGSTFFFLVHKPIFCLIRKKHVVACV